MRLTVFFFTLLCLSTSLFSTASPLKPLKNTVETRLKNGLTLIICPKNTTPVVSIRLFYDVGSIVEKPGSRGLSHLFEHMMFRGSKHVGDEEHSQRIKEVGGISNAYTSDDMTVYYETLPASELELALQLEADRMENLVLNQAVLDKEKEVVKEEYRWRYENNPQGDMFLKARKALFPNHPYEYGAIGTMEDINQASVTQCQEFYKRYYAPNNAVLVIAGDVDVEATQALVQDYFGRIPSNTLKKTPRPKFTKEPGLKRVKERASYPVPLTMVAFHGPPASDSDTLVLSIISAALGSGESARLYKKIIKDYEFAEELFSYAIQNKELSLYVFGGIHLPFHSRLIQHTIWTEIDAIRQEGLTDDELTKIKNNMLMSEYTQNMSSSSLAEGLGRAKLLTGSTASFIDKIKRFEQIDHEDIRRVANQYFTKQNATIITFQPKKKRFYSDWHYKITGFFKALI